MYCNVSFYTLAHILFICEDSGTFYATCYCMYMILCVHCICQSGTVSMIVKLTRTLHSKGQVL